VQIDNDDCHDAEVNVDVGAATATVLHLAAAIEYSGEHYIIRLRTAGDAWVKFDDANVEALDAPNLAPNVNPHTATFLLYARDADKEADFDIARGLYNGFESPHTCYLNSAVQLVSRFYNAELAQAAAANRTQDSIAGALSPRHPAIDIKLRGDDASVSDNEADTVALRAALHSTYPSRYAPGVWENVTNARTNASKDLLDWVELTAGAAFDTRVTVHRVRASAVDRPDVIHESFITLGVPRAVVCRHAGQRGYDIVGRCIVVYHLALARRDHQPTHTAGPVRCGHVPRRYLGEHHGSSMSYLSQAGLDRTGL